MLSSRRRLTLADLATFSEDQRELLALTDAETQADLDQCDFETWEVRAQGRLHTVVHGFPGDNPLGVFVAAGHWIEFGEAVEPDTTDGAFLEFYDWYLTQSQRMCCYDFLQSLPESVG